jgi:hypothetical protein
MFYDFKQLVLSGGFCLKAQYKGQEWPLVILPGDLARALLVYGSIIFHNTFL